jgi:hypothetical protein
MGLLLLGTVLYLRSGLSGKMRPVGIQPYDMIHYDLNAFLPPVDRFTPRSESRWQDHPEKTVSRGGSRALHEGLERVTV